MDRDRCSVPLQARTGGVSAGLPQSLASNMNSIIVNCSAAPGGISINRGASVMDSVTIDEGEDTVTAASQEKISINYS